MVKPAESARRTYDQYCPTAKALDVVGQRWTLLIARELLLGPQRFTDLRAGLPGIGPNVLAERLTQLTEDGLVRRVALPPPAASNVYELTDRGEELRPVIQELSKFGFELLGAPAPTDHFRLGWLMRSLELMFRPDAAAGLHESYEFRLDGEIFHVRVDDGVVRVRQGSAPDPAFTLETDVITFIGMGAKVVDGAKAFEDGRAKAWGDFEAGVRSVEILGPHLGRIGGPGGVLGPVQARIRPEETTGLRETYEFRTEGETFQIQVDDGEVHVRPGSAEEPAFVFVADMATLIAMYLGRVTAPDAVAAGSAELEGDGEAAARAWRLLGVG